MGPHALAHVLRPDSWQISLGFGDMSQYSAQIFIYITQARVCYASEAANWQLRDIVARWMK